MDCNMQSFYTRLILLTALLVSVSVGRSMADDKPEPTTQPANKQHAAKNDRASSGESKVDAVLDKLERKGSDIKSLSCRLIYTFTTPGPIEGIVDTQEKIGSMYFVHTGQPRFLVHFTEKRADGVKNSDSEYYAFNGEWYIERNDRAKTVVRRQMARPGEKLDLFELGKGPFPLPFGRSREEILKHFEVKQKSFNIGASEKPIHLRCLPRPATDLAERYKYVDMIIDPKSDLPVKVICERAVDDSVITVEFREIKESADIDANRFKVPTPTDFQESVEPLDKNEPGDAQP